MNKVVNINDLDTTKLHKKNINTQFGNLKDETYLHYAVEANNLEIVQLLLEKGADVNIQDWHYETPLKLAISKVGLPISYDQEIVLKIIKELINAL